MLNQIKNQLNLAIRSSNQAADHVQKAFELLCELEQTSPANVQGSTVRIIPNKLTKAEKALNGVPAVTRSNGGIKEKAVLAALSRPYPITKATVISETGITQASFSKHLQNLRGKGYVIQCQRGCGAPKYKLAK